jgi:predicted dehydrogenase/threonine dehydrogenase-like Zn-dependent dehydrogenase
VKQVMVRQGQVAVDEVPAPGVERGTVLVRVSRSCISIGTEMSGIKFSGAPLWKKALARPDLAKKVMQAVSTQGLMRTWKQVRGQLDAGNPTGYSAAGTVIEVGEGITDIVPGDRVACAGAQCAHHAEVIRVPRNLCAHVPDELGFDIASTATLGAIAMQGVRRAQPTLGETFVVIGLGILGQMAGQLLKANGCRVIGTDLDRKRIEQARGLGMDLGLHPDDGDAAQQVARLTDGIGADGVIITAATPSDAVVSQAFSYCRKKGRVVLVGDVGLHLNRADFYAKEIDFLISCSYGPGRYDGRYEEEGLDYPPAWVRWTEGRNLGEYLRLCAEGRLRIAPLISATHPVAEATAAYATLKGETKPLIVLLSYPEDAPLPARTVPNPSAKTAAPGAIRLALIGAGSFAKGMHLPNLRSLESRYRIQAVMSRTGHNAQATARQNGAAYATTEIEKVLGDPAVDAVLVATRHDLHARLALQALSAGKHVLLEKPLALTRAELAQLTRHIEERGDRPGPILLTGFNRRFSPCAQRLKQLIATRSNPMLLTYRMNAGYIPLDHWVHGPEGGGRNIGEACHIYDLFTFLTGAKLVSTDVQCIAPKTAHYSKADNFVATFGFDDGSIATLAYTALGAKEHPKEQLEVFCDGKVLTLDDYTSLQVAGARAKGVSSKLPDKGQKEEIIAFADAIQKGAAWPIPWWQQVQATEMAFAVEERLGGKP